MGAYSIRHEDDLQVAGDPANTFKPVESKSPLSNLLTAIIEGLEVLEKDVSRLEDKFSPVLLPPYPINPKEDANETSPPKSEFEQRLGEIQYRIHSLIKNVNMIRDRSSI